MLRFSEGIWRRWLNPATNHNRYRLWQYRHAFKACFEQVEIKILTREEESFRKLLPRIRPEFVSGKIEEDSVGVILVIASKPLIGE
jgi:predicted sulfurtransferase